MYSLHLHPENEDRETQFWGIAPSGSLLVWIDNAFGAPDYTLQRTAGRWSNMRQALPQSAEIDNATFHYTVFGKASDETAQPQQHGAFNDAAFRYWDRSFWGGSVEPFVCSR